MAEKKSEETTFSIIELSWWTLDERVFKPEGITEFMATLERLFPEALPRLYGLFEPPEYDFAETGHDHFVRYLAENVSGSVIWYPSQPALNVSYSSPGRAGPTTRGFRTHRISISVEVSALDQPDIEARLKEVWYACSGLVRPFYGDVRMLAGYVLIDGHLFLKHTSEQHPVNAWWWRGLPAKPASAVVIGPEYQAIWPDLLKKGTRSDSLVFFECDDWRHPASYIPPIELTQRARPSYDPRRPFPPFDAVAERRSYAEVWPFDEPIARAPIGQA